MFGQVPSKHINLMIEGSLLPPIKMKPVEYTNVSDRYLMVWLELLVGQANNTNQFLLGSEEIKVNIRI